MDAEATSRRLVSLGILLFLASLLEGLVIPVVTNPRMGLSAHTGGVMAGTFLAVVGLVWGRLRLSNVQGMAAASLAVYGCYGSTAGLVWAAVFGTSRSTPIAGAGYAGSPWQETVANVILSSSAVAMVACCALLLWGLRRPRHGG
jgi:hydroxylaminobenzene mutase